MNPIKKMLTFVAETIDGELYTYEDGYVIDIKNPSLWIKAPFQFVNDDGSIKNIVDFVSGVKLSFGKEGNFEKIEYC